MIDWDKPIETEDGSPAKVISRDYRIVSLGICMMVQIEEADYSRIASYTLKGDPAFIGPKLRNRRTKREGWINIYDRWTGPIRSTEEEAKESASRAVSATIKIEWEE